MEDKVRRAEAEALELEQQRQQAEREKSKHLAEVQAEKRHNLEADKKAKEAEERAKRAAMEAARLKEDVRRSMMIRCSVLRRNDWM